MTKTPHTPRGLLTIRNAEGKVQTFEFRGRALVGRDPSCTVVLESGAVSRHHAVLEHDDEGWHLRDLNSGNGTRVNRRNVLTSFLSPGDEIIFGEIPARFENLPDAEPTRFESTTRMLTQTLRVTPTRKARPGAAIAVAALCVALLLGATFFARGCVAGSPAPSGRSAPAPEGAR